MGEITDYTRHLLNKHWKPCGLENDAQREILEIQSQEFRYNRKWKPLLAQYSVEKATNQAVALAEKWKKPECHYLNMALKNKWITNFYNSMNE
jgi:hypothetical protein